MRPESPGGTSATAGAASGTGLAGAATGALDRAGRGAGAISGQQQVGRMVGTLCALRPGQHPPPPQHSAARRGVTLAATRAIEATATTAARRTDRDIRWIPCKYYALRR